jgi:hypothetical protein
VSPRPDITKMVLAAWRFHQDSDFQAAFQLCREILAEHPDNPGRVPHSDFGSLNMSQNGNEGPLGHELEAFP